MIKRSRLSEQEGKTTIFSIRRDNVNEYIHPTQKPVELCDISIKNNSKEEDIVMDLFL
jgi:DNA modification methylase